MESTNEQTTEMEKQQSHAVGYGRNKATHDQRKENYRGPQSVDFATMGVVCVVEVTHIKGFALLKVKRVLTVAKWSISQKFVVANPIIGPNLGTQRNPLKVNSVPSLQMLKSLRVVKY